MHNKCGFSRWCVRIQVATHARKALICAEISRKNARARPQPPPGRVERLAPISPCAVKKTGGLWNSLARPDRSHDTSAADRKCQGDVERLSTNCNETRGHDGPRLGLRLSQFDGKRQESRLRNGRLHAPLGNSRYESLHRLWAMIATFVSGEARSKRGWRDGN
jgi:hypothetical protein